VGRQEGISCVGMGERLEVRGAVWTWEQGGRTITRQRVKLRELFSRRKMMRGRGFARTWRERMTRAVCMFRVAKQLVNINRDVVGTNCIKDSARKIVMVVDRLMEVRRAHYDDVWA